MQMKIIKERENPLFDRKEIQIDFSKDVTPSKEEVKKMISEKFSVDLENVEIKKIEGKFGSRQFIIFAHIHKQKKSKDQNA